LRFEATGIGAWSRNLDTGERAWNGQMARIFDMSAPAEPPSLRKLLLGRVLPDDLPKVDALTRSLSGLIHQALPELARAAFMDPSLRTNPRIPLVSELVELLQAGYEGEPAGP
jgi:hypothetical protein